MAKGVRYYCIHKRYFGFVAGWSLQNPSSELICPICNKPVGWFENDTDTLSALEGKE